MSERAAHSCGRFMLRATHSHPLGGDALRKACALHRLLRGLRADELKCSIRARKLAQPQKSPRNSAPCPLLFKKYLVREFRLDFCNSVNFSIKFTANALILAFLKIKFYKFS